MNRTLVINKTAQSSHIIDLGMEGLACDGTRIYNMYIYINI